MQIRLSDYRLSRYIRKEKTIVPGMKVCPCNCTTSVGTITHVGKQVSNRWGVLVPDEVTILWGTGTKRGKKTVHHPDNLTDFTGYITRVKAEYDELDALRLEESMFGT